MDTNAKQEKKITPQVVKIPSQEPETVTQEPVTKPAPLPEGTVIVDEIKQH